MIAWKDGASALTTGMCAHSRQSSLKVLVLKPVTRVQKCACPTRAILA